MSNKGKFRSGTDLPTVAENIQTLTGQRGDGLDRAVTVRDLARLGFSTKKAGNGGVSLIPGWTPPPDWGGAGANKPTQFPTKPTGFTAYGAFSFIALVWDMPKYGGHSLTEVYRNSEDNLADAVSARYSFSTRQARIDEGLNIFRHCFCSMIFSVATSALPDASTVTMPFGEA